MINFQFGVFMKFFTFLWLLLMSLASFASVFNVDPVHSRVGFKVKYMMLSSVYGQFNEFDGQVILKEGEVSNFIGQINVSSIDTNNAKRDQHLKSADFFNINEYPSIKFRSTKVSKNDVGYIAIGELEIHGIKKQVSIPFELAEPIIDAYGNERFGLTGQIRINRKSFGIMYSKKMDNGGLIVDDFVDIDLNVQFVKKS